MDEKEIRRVLERNEAIIRSFGVRRLDLVKPESNANQVLDFQVEFKDVSLGIYEDFKDCLEKLVGDEVSLTLKNPLRPAIH